MNRARLTAAVTALVLYAALAVTLAVTTPWRPLPGRVPGGPTEVDAARDFTQAQIARSAALDGAITPAHYAGLLTGLAVLLLLGLTPLGARLVAGAVRPVRRWPLRVLLAALTITAILWLCGLPFDLWRESVLHRYGLSTQSRPAWLIDQAKSFALTYTIDVIVLLLVYALIRRFPRYWWTGAAAGGFLLAIALSFAYPVVVEPVFNSFTRLPAGGLRTDLLRMADTDGVPVKDVLVADASRRTTTLNAYVSGFGSTRRIVVYDTLLKSAPKAQIESVVAHELGHAKRGDVLFGTLTGALGVAGSICLIFVIVSSPRLLRRSGLTEVGDPRSVALLLAVAGLLTQLSVPVQSLVSRRIEARADVHALDLTRDPTTFAAMQRELSVRNISDLAPDPLEYVLWFTHPSGPERIAMARDWARIHRLPEPPSAAPGGR